MSSIPKMGTRVCQIPRCNTSGEEIEAELEGFLGSYCQVCDKDRGGSLCGCAFPCFLTFKTQMFRKIYELVQAPLPTDKKSIMVCFKHPDLLKNAREACQKAVEEERKRELKNPEKGRREDQDEEEDYDDEEEDEEEEDNEGGSGDSSCFRITYKDYFQRILLDKIRSLDSSLNDVVFLCGDGKSVEANSLLVAGISGYLKAALSASGHSDFRYSLSLPDADSTEVETFFKYTLEDSESLRKNASLEEMKKMVKIARMFCVPQFVHFKNEEEQRAMKRRWKDNSFELESVRVIEKIVECDVDEEDDCDEEEFDEDEELIDEEEDEESESEEEAGDLATTNGTSSRFLTDDPIYLDPDSNCYTCVVCSQRFDKLSDIVSHYRVVHSRRSGMNCDLCEEEPPRRPYFKTWLKLGKHRLERHGTFDEFTNCDVCLESCFTKARLDIHFKTNHPSYYNVVKCEVCPLKFPRETYLTKHRFKEHVDSEKGAHECSLCHRKFSSKKYLSGHISRMHKEGSWPLDEPPKKQRIVLSELKDTSTKLGNKYVAGHAQQLNNGQMQVNSE